MDNNMNFFDLDESSMNDSDFFAVEEGSTPEEESIDETKKPGTPEDDSKAPEDDETKKPVDLFSKAAEEDEEEEEEEEPDTEDGKKPKAPLGEVDPKISTLNYLKEKGLADFELEEGEELTEELAEEIFEDTIDTMFEDRLETLFENLPEAVKKLNKFVIDGGDINEYLNTVAKHKTAVLTPELDMSVEENQIAAVKHGLASEGYDTEYIEAQIEFLKDSKRLEKHGKMHFDKWDENRIKEEEAVLASAAKNKLALKKAQRDLKNKVSSFLKETEEVPGFKVTREDKKSLPSYMTDRTVQLDNGNQVSNMQKDLMRVLNSPTGSFQLAKLLKEASEEGELNFEQIAKQTETKVVKKVRENVRRNKNSIQKDSTGSGTKNKKPLADYFN